jgi:hypothetical protein
MRFTAANRCGSTCCSNAFPAWLCRVIEVTGGVLLMIFAVYAVWLSLPWVQQSFLRGEVSPNPGGLPYRWALKALIPLGFTLLALQGLAHALRHGFGLPNPANRARTPDIERDTDPKEQNRMTPTELLAIGMIVAFFVLLIVGIPVGIAIAVSGLVFGYVGFGPMLFNLLPARIYGVVTNYTFMAIPLFVFMGVMLEKSRLAEELIDIIGHAFGASRAGWGWRSSWWGCCWARPRGSSGRPS